MDRAGANNDKDPIIVARQNPSGIVASGSNSLLRDRGRNHLVAEESGLNKGIVLQNRVRSGKGEDGYVNGCGDGRTPTTRRS